LRFNERIADTYPELYRDSDSGDEEFGQKWGFYTDVYQLAQGDIGKFREVNTYNVHQCLTHLAFETDKAEADRKRMKQKS
jgi:hypothetical protein